MRYALLLMILLPTLIYAQCSRWYTVTVLTRHPADIQEMARDAFLKSQLAKEYCIKDVRFIEIPPGFWGIYAKRANVDVAWGGGPTLFDELYLQGLLRPLEGVALEAANKIPDKIAGMPMKRISHGKIYWVAAAISSFGFTVNRDVAKQLGIDWKRIQYWKDLGSAWLGKIMLDYGVPPVAIADPLQSTSNTRMYEIILQAYGWNKGWSTLTRIAANARIEGSSIAVRDDVISGQVLVGITIDFYGYTAHMLNPACIYVLPKRETIVNGDPIAVMVTTKHPQQAYAFVAWVLTDGQKIWLKPNINRLPANPEVFKYVHRPDLQQAYEQILKFKALKFNDTLALLTELPMQLYFKATLIDLNDQLKQVWTTLLQAYYSGKISKEEFERLATKLGEPLTYKDPVTGKYVTFTIKDAIRVNKILRKELTLKEKYMAAWRQAAEKRYQEVLAAVSG